MAELKTQATTAAPLDLIASVHDEERRENGKTLLDLFEKITKQPSIMWGPTIIGYGKYSLFMILVIRVKCAKSAFHHANVN